MILKVRDEQDFNISMNLNINYAALPLSNSCAY